MNNFRNMQKVTPEVIERLEFILNELEKENCALEIKVELHEIEENMTCMIAFLKRTIRKE